VSDVVGRARDALDGRIAVAAVALGALLLLFSPPALRWLSYSPDSANSDNSGPDTR
jgi:hypothetical protein